MVACDTSREGLAENKTAPGPRRSQRVSPATLASIFFFGTHIHCCAYRVPFLHWFGPAHYPITTYMLFKTRSAAVYGIEAYLVDVEVNISTGGNGQFVIVGLPDTAVRGVKERGLPAVPYKRFGGPSPPLVIQFGPTRV